MEKYFFIGLSLYLLIINLLSIIVCRVDKSAAIKSRRRIPEKTLFLLSLLGGATFMYITMLTIRHKTKHLKFMLTLPLIIILQMSLLFFIIKANI